MGCSYTFDYGLWVARYPEFSSVSADMAGMLFEQACLYWRNDGTSPNRDDTGNKSQKIILNCVTAHIAALYQNAQGSNNPGSAQDPNSPVGRISQAAVGSVNVTTDLGMTPSSSEVKAYFTQTKYGLDFLAMTRAYKLFRYSIGSGPAGGGPITPPVTPIIGFPPTL
jgi:hypothetical protein